MESDFIFILIKEHNIIPHEYIPKNHEGFAILQRNQHYLAHSLEIALLQNVSLIGNE